MIIYCWFLRTVPEKLRHNLMNDKTLAKSITITGAFIGLVAGLIAT